MATPASPELKPFVRQNTILLTSYKRDGTGVGTPVHIAVDGDHAYIRTFDKAWKAKRMRRDPRVEIRPSTARGRPTGPGHSARVRLLDPGSAEATHAARLIARKYPVMQGVLVPVFHRLRRMQTLHYEVRLTSQEQ